jgi:hypothetical protein
MRANRSDETAIAETMVDRVERRFDLKPARLAGDTAYGAAKLLKWLWEACLLTLLDGLVANVRYCIGLDSGRQDHVLLGPTAGVI